MNEVVLNKVLAALVEVGYPTLLGYFFHGGKVYVHAANETKQACWRFYIDGGLEHGVYGTQARSSFVERCASTLPEEITGQLSMNT